MRPNKTGTVTIAHPMRFFVSRSIGPAFIHAFGGPTSRCHRVATQRYASDFLEVLRASWWDVRGNAAENATFPLDFDNVLVAVSTCYETVQSLPPAAVVLAVTLARLGITRADGGVGWISNTPRAKLNSESELARLTLVFSRR
jgi:hypothetical protein